MATLKTNTLTGTSTAGSIAVTGEGNSTTTNLQQGLGKCWCHFDGTAGSVSFDDSFNMSGLTDNGTGDFTVAFANDMANATYASAVACTNNNALYNAANTATGSIRFVTMDSNNSLENRTLTSYLNLGDLA